MKNPSVNLAYNTKEVGFQELISAVALGTKAVFGYHPSKEEIVKYISKKQKKGVGHYTYETIPEHEKEEAINALQAAEKLLHT